MRSAKFVLFSVIILKNKRLFTFNVRKTFVFSWKKTKFARSFRKHKHLLK